MRLIWQFLNTAFGIWLMFTIVVGFGAAIITEQQSCKTQATQLSERYSRISGEVRQREANLFRAILAANSATQVASALASYAGPQAGYRYLEFKDRTLVDLREEYAELSNKLIPPSWRLFSPKDPTAAWYFIDSTAITYEDPKIFETEHLRPLVRANSVLGVALDENQFDIAELKTAVQTLTELQPTVQFLDYFLSSGSQCTFWQAFKDRVGLSSGPNVPEVAKPLPASGAS